MEEKKKSKKGLVITIILLILIILGLVGYICYNKGLIFKTEKEVVKKENKGKKEKVEYLETEDERVSKTMNQISSGLSYYCGVYEYYKDKKVTVDSLDEEVISSVALSKIVNDYFEKNNNDYTKSMKGYTFTADEYEKVVKSIFKVKTVEHKSLRNCPSFEYDASTKKYTAGEPACGGTCGPGGFPITKVTKALIKNNTMEVYMRILFVDYDNSGKPIYYYDYAKTEKVPDVAYSDDNTPIDIEYKVDNKAALYKITFDIEDDNYLFVSSEPVK